VLINIPETFKCRNKLGNTLTEAAHITSAFAVYVSAGVLDGDEV
jgi:hypothetical protein